MAIADIYNWGRGVAVDYPRAMAAYKVGVEGGSAVCQHQLGIMYYFGHGVAVDYQQARPWIEKAAAQDDPEAVCQLMVMYSLGHGVTPSWRRARELYQRAIGLGNSTAVENMQGLTEAIQQVSYVHLPPLSSSPIPRVVTHIPCPLSLIHI